MRFLVDECIGPMVASWLKSQKHEVFSVFDEARGMDDEQVIQKAITERWILITNDKGFGERVYRDGQLHRGVILLRLEDESPRSKIRVLSKLLESFSESIPDAFIVATENQVRFARTSRG